MYTSLAAGSKSMPDGAPSKVVSLLPLVRPRRIELEDGGPFRFTQVGRGDLCNLLRVLCVRPHPRPGHRASRPACEQPDADDGADREMHLPISLRITHRP